jgi:DNA-binding transcriptional regulator YiaG
VTDLPVLRHLDYGPGATVHELGAAGLQGILDGTDVDGWRPVLKALARDPWGPVAVRVEQVLDHLETYGTARLLRQWLRHCRAGADQPAVTLADLRRDAGLSQRQLASRLGISQAQVARTESSPSPSMRSLSRYLQALSLSPVALVVTSNGGGHIVQLAKPRDEPRAP